MGVGRKVEYAGDKGFTLFEILIAVFILAVVVSTVYAAYSGTFRIIADSEYSDNIYSMARNTLGRMMKDLESSCGYGGSYKFFLQQVRIDDRLFPMLSFNSSAHVSFAGDGDSSGIAAISYSVEKDDEDGGYALLRKDAIIAGKEDEAEDAYVICRKIQSLAFKFYNRNGKEFNSWNSDSDADGQKNKAPSAVLIDLKLIDPARKDIPYRFFTKVKIGAS